MLKKVLGVVPTTKRPRKAVSVSQKRKRRVGATLSKLPRAKSKSTVKKTKKKNPIIKKH